MPNYIFGDNKKEKFLEGKLLIATSSLNESVFNHSVIFMCTHNAQGAMGFIINSLMYSIDYNEILEQLDIKADLVVETPEIHFGGPVEQTKGFFLHSNEYNKEGTIKVNNKISLTSNVDILEDVVAGNGPQKSLLALGYAGWEASQLESEIKNNDWLVVSSSDRLLFEVEPERKWQAALDELGINMNFFSPTTGSA